MNNTTKTIMAAIMLIGHVCAIGAHRVTDIPDLTPPRAEIAAVPISPPPMEHAKSMTASMPIPFGAESMATGALQIPFINFELDRSGFNPDEAREYMTIIFGRHFPTDANKAEKANGDAGVVSGDSLGSEDLVAWQTMALRFRFSLIMSAITERHYATARALAEKTSKGCLRMSCFDEQKLGKLDGEDIKKIISSPEFQEMLLDREYKIPGGGESGKEVIERLKTGIIFVLGQLSLSTPAERLAYVCTSRCTLNWLLRYLLDDYSFSQLRIPNCGMFIVRYFPDTRELQLCNRDAILPESTKELHDILKMYEINTAAEAERWRREFEVSPRCKTPSVFMSPEGESGRSDGDLQKTSAEKSMYVDMRPRSPLASSVSPQA